MKKIILSVAVATMALSTTASALEDIKVNGSAKVWYETDNNEKAGAGDIFNKTDASAEVVFKLGMTGKQGDVGFGAEITQGSTMGLEGTLVSGARTGTANSDMYVSKMYVTAPVAPNTIVKLGRQELNTPFAFTEKWNAQQNNFDGAVFINSSVPSLTLIGAYVGQTNTDIGNLALAGGDWKAQNSFSQLHGGAFAAGALYANAGISANVWLYDVLDIANSGVTNNTTHAGTGINAQAVWVDAGYKIGDVANVKAIFATMTNSGSATNNAGGVLNGEATTGFALSADTSIAGVKLFAAASMVGEGDLPLANVATNFKKTKLPTAGVYTDGQYVAQPETMAFKVKASGKVAEIGYALQFVNNTGTADNSANAGLDTTEIDLIVSKKVGAFNLKGILMNRMMDDSKENQDGQHVRVIASLKF